MARMELIRPFPRSLLTCELEFNMLKYMHGYAALKREVHAKYKLLGLNLKTKVSK